PIPLHRAKPAREVFTIRGALPLGRFRRDRGAHFEERIGLGHPQSAAEKDLSRSKVNVQARSMGVPSQAVAEVAGGMFLIRTSVARETAVAIDAEHRAPIGPGIGDELLAHALKMRRHRAYEFRHRTLDGGSEALLVGLEPGPLIVLLELAE